MSDDPHKMFTRYGMMFECDCDVIDACLAECVKTVDKANGVVRILELGIYEGHTGRGMKKFLEERGYRIDYWGIDPGFLKPVVPPFEGANVITGKSEECFHLVPGCFDLIFVDGNHSRNGVILDTFNYEEKVYPMGFMLFHDTNPKCQGQGYEYYGPQIPQFGIAVREAWALMGWPWDPWTMWMERYPTDHHQNGTTAFRRR